MEEVLIRTKSVSEEDLSCVVVNLSEGFDDSHRRVIEELIREEKKRALKNLTESSTKGNIEIRVED